MQHTPPTSLAEHQAACDAILAKTDLKPTVGLILGSGLGPLADEIKDPVSIPYADIPNFQTSTAPSHAGRLVIGNLCGQRVVVMQGRVHTYEGYSPQEVTFPVRTMKLMGVERLIVTNAAGGLNLDYKEGDLMLIEDHIHLAGCAVGDPTRGPNIDAFGPRFTSLSQAYDTELLAIAKKAAKKLKISLRPGVLAFRGGPSFETPAEARMLRILGADAVCMSTVPEVISANHCGMRVVAISAITNMVVDTIGSNKHATEDEVFDSAEKIVPYFTALVRNIVASFQR